MFTCVAANVLKYFPHVFDILSQNSAVRIQTIPTYYF